MNRKQFIESFGGTCRNWTWSWSFVNEAERMVIFGAWDKDTSGNRSMILDEAWRTGTTGRKTNGFNEARVYLRLVEEQNYRLFTFPMIFSNELQDARGVGPARIKRFERKLTERTLIRVGAMWYASDGEYSQFIPEEIQASETYVEGARKVVTINAFERNSSARAACLNHYGPKCAVCGFTGKEVYGAIGEKVIHVHHIVPIADLKGEYVLDAIRDLVPVCPNCHAVIHSTRPALTVDQLRSHLGRPSGA